MVQLVVAATAIFCVLQCLLFPTCNAVRSSNNFNRMRVKHHKMIQKKDPIMNDQTHSAIFGLRGGDMMPSSQPSVHQALVTTFLNQVDLFGTGIFAFSGALIAGRKGMSLLGILFVAGVTAMGGGTVVDILLGSRTVFWLQNPIYLKICFFTTLWSYYVWPILEKKFGWKDSAVTLCTADAFGLAAFAVLGTQKGVKMGLHPSAWVACGLLSSVCGGITRDILCLQAPRIMYPNRSLYATSPFLGSVVYSVLTWYNILDDVRIVASISFLVTFISRVIFFNKPSWSLPHWEEYVISPEPKDVKKEF